MTRSTLKKVLVTSLPLLFIFTLSLDLHAYSDAESAVITKLQEDNLSTAALSSNELDLLTNMKNRMRNKIPAALVAGAGLTGQDEIVLRSIRNPPPADDKYNGFVVVFTKNARGHYIPQLTQESRWDPNRPGAGISLGGSVEDQIWRQAADGKWKTVSCDRDTSAEKIASGYSCAIPDSSESVCTQDSAFPPNQTMKSMSENFDCSKKNKPTNEAQCLACNIYFESKSQGTLGMEAVVEITLNSAAMRVRKGKTKTSPICDAVYQDSRFSWTLKDKSKVDTSNVIEQRAWMEAIYLASQNSDNSDPSASHFQDPKLHCYRYYVSLDFFKELNTLPTWAQVYYNKTINKSRPFRPLCIGEHIFLRDPEENCPQLTTSNTHEHDGPNDQEHRSDTYQTCFNMTEAKVPAQVGTRPSPNYSICKHNTIEEAVAAHRASARDTSPPGVHTPAQDVGNAEDGN